MTKLRLRIPFVGFAFTLFAFIASIVALSKYLNLYSVAGYPTNWWTVMHSALSILFLAVILLNSVFLADDPFFMIVFYVATAFMLIYGALAMLQPCISEIAFVLGSPDLAMGDNAIRVFISDNAIATTVWYVVAAVCTIVGVFTPNMLMGKDEGNNVAADKLAKAISALQMHNKIADKIVETNELVRRCVGEIESIPDAPVKNDEQSQEDKITADIAYAHALYNRLVDMTVRTRNDYGVYPSLGDLVERANRVMRDITYIEKNVSKDKKPQLSVEEVNNG